MRCFSKLIKLGNLYNLFLFLALLNIFFSTENSVAKTFSIKEIEISSPFNASFDKNKIINRGFVEAYEELIFTIAQSKDQKKLQNSSTKEVKSLVETFSIVQESFIDEIYNLTLNVEFNKKSFFELLEKKNVFPSSIIQKDLIFFPIEVDEEKNEIFLFSESQLFKNWNFKKEKYHQLNYILPNEDIDDYNLIKKNINNLEDFDFREISKNKKVQKINLDIKGRNFTIKNFYEGTIKLDFKDLCDKNIGAEDYIEIAKNCSFLFLENLPNFDENNSNQQQRFITLIDILYEKKIPLLITSEKKLNEINSSPSLKNPFKRTISRLYELTSINYQR